MTPRFNPPALLFCGITRTTREKWLLTLKSSWHLGRWVLQVGRPHPPALGPGSLEGESSFLPNRGGISGGAGDPQETESEEDGWEEREEVGGCKCSKMGPSPGPLLPNLQWWDWNLYSTWPEWFCGNQWRGWRLWLGKFEVKQVSRRWRQKGHKQDMSPSSLYPLLHPPEKEQKTGGSSVLLQGIDSLEEG